MSTPSRLLTSVLAAGALCAPLVLHGGPLLPPAGIPSSTMKTLDQMDPATIIESLPFVITQPGRYALRSSLDCPPGASAIVVLASDVVIDGGGFSLRGGGGAGGLHGVFVEGSRSGIHIKDVIIEAFSANGVHAPDSQVACRSVVCRENSGSGFVLNIATLEDCDGLDNGGHGCDVLATRPGRGHVTLMKRCDFSGNASGGLRVADGIGTDCDDVRANENGGDGFDIQGAAAGHTKSGHVTLLKRCEARGNIGAGLRVAETDRLACDDSTFLGNEQEGVHITGRTGHVTLMKRCDSSGNASAGLRIEDADRLECEDSTFRGTTGVGLVVLGRTGHVTLMKRCDVSSNTLTGLLVFDADRVVCEDSTFTNQGEDGVAVQGRTGHVTLMKRCDSSHNAGAGLRLDRGSADCDDSLFSGNGQQGVVAVLGEGFGAGLPPQEERLHLHACRVESNGGAGVLAFSGSDDARLRLHLSSSLVSSNGAEGCRVECPDAGVSSTVVVSSSTLHRNLGSGLHILPGPDNDCDGEADDSVFSSNGVHGVHVEGGASTGLDVALVLRDSACSSNQLDGASVDLAGTTGSSSVAGSSLACDSNGGDGLAYSSGGGAGKAQFKEFTITRNGAAGARLVPGPGDGSDGLPPSTLEVSMDGGLASGNLEDGATLVASSGGGAGKASMQDFHFRLNGGNGFSTNSPLHAEGCDFSGNGQSGLVVQGKKEFKGHVTLLKRCAATDNTAHGLVVDTEDPEAVMDLHLVETACSSNGGDGANVACRAATAVMALACTGSSFNDNQQSGMLIVPVAMDKGLRFRAASSSFSGNADAGFQTGPDRLGSCDISSSEASGNGASGLHIECDAVHLASNNIGSNGQDGVFLAGAAGGVVRDNTCTGNAGRGITINTSHVEYATNRCASNGAAGIELVGGFGNVLADSFVSGNVAPGIVLNSSENRLHGNSSGLSAGFIFTPDPSVVNDIAPELPASLGGDTNVGF